MTIKFAMTVATSSTLSDVSQRVVNLQVITLIWMSVEAVTSLATAWTSHSPALLAFGGDSLIELLSAAVVFWRFRFALSEARAARIAGGLLFALAGFVVLNSGLSFFGYREAQHSLVGIGILLAAGFMMPWRFCGFFERDASDLFSHSSTHPSVASEKALASSDN